MTEISGINDSPHTIHTTNTQDDNITESTECATTMSTKNVASGSRICKVKNKNRKKLISSDKIYDTFIYSILENKNDAYKENMSRISTVVELLKNISAMCNNFLFPMMYKELDEYFGDYHREEIYSFIDELNKTINASNNDIHKLIVLLKFINAICTHSYRYRKEYEYIILIDELIESIEDSFEVVPESCRKNEIFVKIRNGIRNFSKILTIAMC